MKQKLEVGENFNPYKMFVGSFIPTWLECRTEISPGAKLVYARMSRYAGRNGRCNPRQGVLSKTIGLGERQARTYIKELEEYCLIESERLGLGKSNIYKFLVHDWMFADQERKDTADQERKDTAEPDGKDTAEPDGKDTAAPTLSLRESIKRINGRESAKAHFPETANQPQENPNDKTLPTETSGDCDESAPTGGLRDDSERTDPSLDSTGVGEDFPAWIAYVMKYYDMHDPTKVKKHLKKADKVGRLTGEKVAAWCARCGTLQEWLRSNVDGTFFGKTNGRAYSNGFSGNGHSNGNGNAAPQFKQAAAPVPAIDEKTRALIYIIAQVTFKNLSIKQHSDLCQAAAVELAKVGATCEIITSKFGTNSWWYQKDWRGQRGSCPTPAQLIEVWGQWENTNGNGENGTTRKSSRNGFIPGKPCQWKGDNGDGTPKPVRTSTRTYDV